MARLRVPAATRKHLTNRKLGRARRLETSVVLQALEHLRLREQTAMKLEARPHQPPAQASEVVAVVALVKCRRYIVAPIDVALE